MFDPIKKAYVSKRSELEIEYPQRMFPLLLYTEKNQKQKH